MKKICNGCGEERDVEEDFNWKYKDRGIRRSRCKYCQSQTSKQHYQTHKQSYIDRNLLRNPRVREENQRKIAAYLAYHPCIDCGQTDIRVLDFDHVRDVKAHHISRMVQVSYSWSAIEAEIAKCEVRCANCHRIKTGSTGNGNGSWRHFFDTLSDRLHSGANRSLEAMRKAQKIVGNQQILYAYLSESPCVDCGCSDVRVLEFDHVRGDKYNSISRLLTSGASWERLHVEIAKCEVRCANCHRVKTMERGDWWKVSSVEENNKTCGEDGI